MADKPNFFTTLKTKEVIITKPYVEVHLPFKYFGHRIAEVIGNEIETFGLFNVYVWETYDYETTKPTSYFFKFPSKIRTIPSSFEDKTIDGKKMRVLSYSQNDVFIKTTDIQLDSDVARHMLDIVFNAYLPDLIPYNEIHSFWSEVNRFNGVKPAASEAVLEIIVSEICRDPHDPSRPFRHLIRTNPKTSMNDRLLMNIRNIPKYNSTFAAITSGNPKVGITTSISRLRQGKEEQPSPVEEAIS